MKNLKIILIIIFQSTIFFMGNPSIIKFLLYDRKVSCKVFGYIDNISEFGNLENNIKSNIKYDEIKKIYKKGGDTNG